MMNNRPQLSIIVPVYNVSSYLEEALESLYHQSCRDFELIAVNDGSTDGSGHILESYQEKDNRMSVFHRTNHGLSATRNFGLKKAKGRYVYFFDSDDRLKSGALETVFSVMETTKSDICTFSGECIDEHSRPVQTRRRYTKPHFSQPVTGQNLFVHMYETKKYSPVVSMYLYRQLFLNRYQLQFTEGFIHEDEAFTAQALCLAERCVSIPDVLYEHRIRRDSIMQRRRTLDNVKGWMQAYTEMLSFIEKVPVGNKAKRTVQYRANYLLSVAVDLFRSLEKEGMTEDLNMREFLDSNGYEPFDRMIRLRYYTPFLYRIVRRLKWIFSSVKFG